MCSNKISWLQNKTNKRFSVKLLSESFEKNLCNLNLFLVHKSTRKITAVDVKENHHEEDSWTAWWKVWILVKVVARQTTRRLGVITQKSLVSLKLERWATLCRRGNRQSTRAVTVQTQDCHLSSLALLSVIAVSRARWIMQPHW